MHMIPTECMFSRALIRPVCFKAGKIKKATRDGSLSELGVNKFMACEKIKAVMLFRLVACSDVKTLLFQAKIIVRNII